jgi:hypothetical protein
LNEFVFADKATFHMLGTLSSQIWHSSPPIQYLENEKGAAEMNA